MRYCNRQYLWSYFQAANQNNFSGTLVWSVYADVPETSFLLGNGYLGEPGYDFQWSQA